MTDEAKNPTAERQAQTEKAREAEILPVEHYAAVLAHLAFFPAPDHPEVLARLKVDPAVWGRTHDSWTERLEATRAPDEHSVAAVFGKAFSEKKAALDAEQPELASIGELPAERSAAEPAPAPQQGPELLAKPFPAAEAPQAPQAAPAAVPPPAAVRGPVAASSARSSPWEAERPAAQAAVVAPPPMVPPSSPPVAAEPAVAPVKETVLATPVVDAEPLPFRQGANPDFEARLRAESTRPRPVHDQVGETQEASPVAGEGPALPFDGERSKAPARSEPPKSTSPKPAMDETMGIAALIDSGPALPFTDKPTPEGRTTPGSSQPPAQVGATPLEPDLAGETQELSGLMERVAALPFGKPASQASSDPSLPQLTVQQYASLRAELAVYPDQQAQIFKRYGIQDAGAFDELDAAWTQRSANEPELKTQLDEMVPRFCAWLERQKRSSKG